MGTSPDSVPMNIYEIGHTPGFIKFGKQHHVDVPVLIIHHGVTENTDPGTDRQDGGKSFCVTHGVRKTFLLTGDFE